MDRQEFSPHRLVKVVNLTGHTLTLFDGIHRMSFNKNHRAARVNSGQKVDEVVGVDNGRMIVQMPILRITEQEVVNLPDPQDGVLYVVSGIVAAHAGREDVVAPSRVERLESTGIIRAAMALARLEPQ